MDTITEYKMSERTEDYLEFLTLPDEWQRMSKKARFRAFVERVPPKNFAELVGLYKRGVISYSLAKDFLWLMFLTGCGVKTIAQVYKGEEWQSVTPAT